MYNAYLLKPQTNECVQKLRNELGTKPQVLVVSLARAIAARLCIPTACVASASEYFTENCTQQARKLISCMSDIIAFDVQAVLDTTKTMWMVRYKAAYPSDIIYDVPGACSEASFLGYGSVISAAEIKFIQENNVSLILSQNNFSRVLSDVLGQKEVAQESKK